MGVTFHARPRPLPPSEPRRDDAAVLRSNPPPADGTLVATLRLQPEDRPILLSPVMNGELEMVNF